MRDARRQPIRLLLRLTPVALFLLAFPLAASARPTATPSPGAQAPTHLARFSLRSSGGYKVSVSALGKSVDLEVSRGSAYSAYFGQRQGNAKRLSATFGELGRVSVRFHPSGKVIRSQPQSGCKGPDHFTTRAGVFVGQIRFSGEGGYTSLNAHRAKGTVQSPLGLTGCKSEGLHHGSGSHPKNHGSRSHPSRELALTVQSPASATGQTSFSAIAPGSIGRAVFAAFSSEKVGSLLVLRSVLTLGSSQAFLFDNALSSASVSPPAPFTGTGSFQRNADGSTTWAGDLAASFPGKPDVALTGTTFTAKLACEPSSAGFIVVVTGHRSKTSASTSSSSCKIGQRSSDGGGRE
jgi:hypothetical protein